MGGTEKVCRAVELLCVMLWWWIHVIICLTKTIECTGSRLNLNVHHGFWVLTVCQCRFIKCKECAALWGVVMVGGPRRGRRGARGTWERPVLPLSLAANLL